MLNFVKLPGALNNDVKIDKYGIVSFCISSEGRYHIVLFF